MTLHPVVRRALRLLSASFALAWVAIAMTVAPGSAAWIELSGRLTDAGVYIAAFYVAVAAGAGVGGRAMDRWGRRPVLAAAHVLAAAGYLTAGLAYGARSLPGFAVGTLALATGTGVVYLTRLAAADLFPVASRGRGVAVVQLSATFGAVVGPLLLVASGPVGEALGRSPQSLVWFVAPPLLLLAAALVLAAPEPLAVARDLSRYHPAAAVATAAPVALGAPRPTGALPVAFLTLALAQGAMAAVMGVTGAALGHAGHGVGVMGLVMALHFVGMFGLSTIVGRVADRAGRRRTMLAGLATLALGAGVVALVPGVVGLGAGLLVVGFGWSFAYIGASLLVTDVTSLTVRARVLGLADLVTSLTAAAVAVLAGWWFASRGLTGLGLVAALLTLPPLVAALALRERRPGVYGRAPDAAPVATRAPDAP